MQISFLKFVEALLSKRLLQCVLLAAVLCSSAAAQQANQPKDPTDIQVTPTSTAVDITQASASILTKRADFAAQLDNVKKNLDAATENTPPDVIEGYKKIVQLYDRIDSVFGQQLGVLKQIESTKSSIAQAQNQLTQFKTNGPAEKAPYSYLLLDSLRSQLTAEREKAPTLDGTMKTLQSRVDQNRSFLQEKNNARILSKEMLDKNNDESLISTLVLRHRAAQLESQIAEENLFLSRLETENQKQARALYDVQIALIQERIKWIEKDAVFSDEDLKDQLQRMDAFNVELNTRLIKANDNLQLARKKLEIAQDKSAKNPDHPLFEEQEKVRIFERDYCADEFYILPKRIDRTDDRRLVWQRRYDVVNGKASIEQMEKWISDSNTRIAALESDRLECASRLTIIRNDLGKLTEKFEQLKDDKKITDVLRDQQKALQDRIALWEDNVARIESLKRFHATLLDEIKQQTQTLSWDELLQYVKVKLDGVMSYSVWSSQKADEETEEFNLTVSNIVAALAYLIFGVFIARLLSRWGVRFVLNRLGAHEGATAAIQSLSYYLFLVIVLSLTFKAISIPLTAFAFFGGALAIGIGFGSQNILNNFISGIILLIERPIRVGDLIEVDGVAGSVAGIGPRCTRLTTFSNIDHLIPNSLLLENKVVNLTLEDTVVRTTVSVGVAYGSDLRKVFHLIRKAVDEHGLINRHPDPIVTLTDFGDNALIFEVRFWLTMSDKVNRLIIESDVRHRVYNLFGEAGISIAFPQRDIHLDTTRPLEIRMTSETPDDGSNSPQVN